MTFFVDAALGGLAKGLRFLGLDARLAVLRKGRLPAPAADTVLLTANRTLHDPGRGDLLILESREPEAQLREVIRRLRLTRRQFRPLSRCVRCNTLLRELPRHEAQDRVPEHILVTQTEFYLCPGCQRVYWPGSHVANISRRLSRMLTPRRRQGDAHDCRNHGQGQGDQLQYPESA